MPEHRGQGFARALLLAVRERAQRLGAAAIHAVRATDDRGVLEACRALGCHESIRAVEWVLDAEHVRAECNSLLTRLRVRRPEIMTGVTILPLSAWSDMDTQRVIALHMAHLGGDRDELAQRLSGSAGEPFHPQVSFGLFDDAGNTLGCALAVVPSDIAARPDSGSLEGIVVAPSSRRRAITPTLKHAVATAYLSVGGRRFSLLTLDPHRDTRRQAERLNPARTRELLRPYLLLRP